MIAKTPWTFLHLKNNAIHIIWHIDYSEIRSFFHGDALEDHPPVINRFIFEKDPYYAE